MKEILTYRFDMQQDFIINQNNFLRFSLRMKSHYEWLKIYERVYIGNIFKENPRQNAKWALHICIQPVEVYRISKQI